MKIIDERQRKKYVTINALTPGAVFEDGDQILMKLARPSCAVNLYNGVTIDFQNEPHLVIPLDAELVINWETPYKGGENHE